MVGSRSRDILLIPSPATDSQVMASRVTGNLSLGMVNLDMASQDTASQDMASRGMASRDILLILSPATDSLDSRNLMASAMTSPKTTCLTTRKYDGVSSAKSMGSSW